MSDRVQELEHMVTQWMAERERRASADSFVVGLFGFMLGMSFGSLFTCLALAC